MLQCLWFLSDCWFLSEFSFGRILRVTRARKFSFEAQILVFQFTGVAWWPLLWASAYVPWASSCLSWAYWLQASTQTILMWVHSLALWGPCPTQGTPGAVSLYPGLSRLARSLSSAWSTSRHGRLLLGCLYRAEMCSLSTRFAWVCRWGTPWRSAMFRARLLYPLAGLVLHL